MNSSLALIIAMIVILMSCVVEKPPSRDSVIDPSLFSSDRSVASGLLKLFYDVSQNVILTSLEKLEKDTEDLKRTVLDQCELANKFQSTSSQAQDELEASVEKSDVSTQCELADKSQSTSPQTQDESEAFVEKPEFQKCVFLQPIQESFLKAMKSYHFTEAFQIGKIARDDYVLQHHLYSTQINASKISKQIVNNENESSNTDVLRGFLVFEYLSYIYEIKDGLNSNYGRGQNSHFCSNGKKQDPRIEEKAKDEAVDLSQTVLGNILGKDSSGNNATDQCDRNSSQSIPGADGSGNDVTDQFDWNRLTDQKKFQYRCQYMKQVVTYLTNDVEKLHASWKPVNGDPLQSNTYRKDFRVLQTFAIELAQALEVIDKKVKDERLGIPLGIQRDPSKGGCEERDRDQKKTCPEKVEHLFSGESIHSLLYTARGLMAVFTGDKINENLEAVGPGYGLEEWLSENGHSDLAQDFKKKTSTLIKSLSEFKNQNTSVLQLLLTSSTTASDTNFDLTSCQPKNDSYSDHEACQLYKKVKILSDLFKGPFLLAVGVQPSQQGGDAD